VKSIASSHVIPTVSRSSENVGIYVVNFSYVVYLSTSNSLPTLLCLPSVVLVALRFVHTGFGALCCGVLRRKRRNMLHFSDTFTKNTDFYSYKSKNRHCVHMIVCRLTLGNTLFSFIGPPYGNVCLQILEIPRLFIYLNDIINHFLPETLHNSVSLIFVLSLCGCMVFFRFTRFCVYLVTVILIVG